MAALERFRLSAHLGYLFEQQALADRFAAASRAGFCAVELQDPYRLSIAEFRRLCHQNNLAVAQIALPSGISGAARKGLAALPGSEAEFEEALKRSIEFAKAVHSPLIHPMAGMSGEWEPNSQWDVYLSNLAKACSAAALEGLSVIIEAISACGTPNYFMNSLAKACAAIDLVNAPNLQLSLDTYHASAMGVHLPSFILENCARIAHVQLADWPNRNEPGSGQTDFDAIFAALRDCGYKGYLGIEYIPAENCGSFDWIADFDAYLEPLSIKRFSSSAIISQR